MPSEKAVRVSSAVAAILFLAAGIGRPVADYLRFHQFASASTLQDLSGLSLLVGGIAMMIATRHASPRRRAAVWREPIRVIVIALVVLLGAIGAGAGLHWLLEHLQGEQRLWFQ